MLGIQLDNRKNIDLLMSEKHGLALDFKIFFNHTKNLLHRYLTEEGTDVNFNSAVNSTTSVE